MLWLLGWFEYDTSLVPGQNRILGIDLGDRRVGLALSDESGMTARPLQTLEIRRRRDVWAKLKPVLEEYPVGRAVVGYPLHMSGELSERAQVSAHFAEKFAEKFAIPAELVDERWTSQEAKEMLQESGPLARKDKGAVDAVAAALILQSYLDARSEEV